MKILNGMKLILVAMFTLLLLNSTVYAESAYTLTEVDEPGANVITKYIYDSVSGEVTPVYYEVSLNQTTYGSGDSSLTYTVNGINGGTYEIIANYSEANLHERITENMDGADVQWDFANLSGTESGGAISNSGTIGNITGNFINNSVASRDTGGGAIYNNAGTIGNITGDFIGNNADASQDWARGGAIYNYASDGATATIRDITSDFIGNYTNAPAGAICNYADDGNTTATINNIIGEFIGNHSATYGGAIYNYAGDGATATIGDITGDFIVNNADAMMGSAYGGAISNYAYNDEATATIGNIKGDFINNFAYSSSYSAYGGAIYNYAGDGATATIGDITGDFIDNFAAASEETQGGAIYNDGEIGTIQGSFIGNYAESTSGEAKGGAIYTTKDLNLVSDNYTMVFSGNYTKSGDEVDDNAIYVASSSATLNFNISNGGSVVMEDNIRGEEGYKVNIEGDDVDNTTFYMLNDMYSANLSVGGTTLNTVNNEIHRYEFNSFSLTGDINMVVDVDLKNETMDRITANSYGDHQGTLTVSGWNLLSDTTKDSVSIYFAEEGLKDYVANGDNNELPTSYQTTAYTPIYKYIVEYDNRDDGGYFVFTKGGGGSGGNSSDSFNPAVLVSSVASQLGAYTALTTTYEYAFEHSNYYMKLPNATRLAMQNGNKYAITENNNTFYQSNEMTDRGMWYRPYTSFESANLKRGPKVDAINYGTLIGGDSDFKEYKNGWGGVFSAYVGYNGSSLSYSGVHTYQNGGLLGVTQTFYKNNFFTALTATAGASVGEANTMYGHENFTMLMAGVASKTGYNLEFKEGRFIIQPSLLLSYSFINTFDYRNAAGVRINSDPLHAIEINPNIRFVMNCQNGWQPYASVGMIWNILDETKVTANNVTLPEMSVRPYVEYGLGIQRLWNDKYGGYLQAMIRNGGRNGVVLTAGFRFKFGEDGKPMEKVHVPQDNREIIKQL